jgi:6-phosphofructokinase 1
MNCKSLEISHLGPCKIDSPLHELFSEKGQETLFVGDHQRAVFDVRSSAGIPSVEIAGPRRKIYFKAAETSAAIVTCGGLCPGLNDVIRALVMTLYYRYGVQRIVGIPYGYEGFIDSFGHSPVDLTPSRVTEIHKSGGTILGTSRGSQDSNLIVDYLERKKINSLFLIGGDGTLRAGLEISEIAEKRKAKISVVGIPKTVDNDILYIDRSFGFATAVSVAATAIRTAHSEAIAQRNGVGLVKLMGRHSGFITCLSALAMNDANFVLIPEIPFDLEGEKGFLKALERRLKARGHAVVLVSEGAGQELFEGEVQERDASGNIRFKDIGLFLKGKINQHFKKIETQVNVKYIDPSYVIRAVEAFPIDSVYCSRLAQNAVHAAMSGRTKMVVGLRHNQYVHLPMSLLANGRRRVDPNSDLWLSVLEATGQPAELVPGPGLSAKILGGET